MWTLNFAAAAAFLAIISLINASDVRKNTLTGPYEAEAENLAFWDLVGSSKLAGRYIRLTPDQLHKQGGIWNNHPCIINDWEIQAHFHIHGKGVNLFGDGMAIWYVRDSKQNGHVFGSKNYFSGLGVFIDTFENHKLPHKHRHPYISAMVNNGSLHYEHTEDGAMTQIGGCHMQVRNLEVPTKIAISYISNALSVYVDNEGLNQWKLCFNVPGIHLPTGYHIGVTASTSDVSDNHDIISVATLNLSDPNKKWKDRSGVIPKAENVIILERYHRDFIETQNQKKKRMEQQKKGHKREVKEEDEEEEEILDEEEPIKIKKPVKPSNTQEKLKPTQEATRSPPASTSLLTKFVYIVGAIILILVAMSIYKKNKERRREKMQKRLF